VDEVDASAARDVLLPLNHATGSPAPPTSWLLDSSS